MAVYLRQGTCNQCGQCCGAPYFSNPNPDSPWPNDWPWAVYSWSDECLDTTIGRALIRVLQQDGHGSVRIIGKQYFYIAVEGYGIVADVAPLGDPSTFENRCPFLRLNGETSTPPTACGAVTEGIYINLCSKYPDDRVTEDYMLQWTAAFPACSYTWVEEG